MDSAGRSWQVPVSLLCCTWLWAQAGAEVGARERSHPSPAPAHPNLAVATQSQTRAQIKMGCAWSPSCPLTPTLQQDWVAMWLEATLGHRTGGGSQPGCATSALLQPPRTQG